MFTDTKVSSSETPAREVWGKKFEFLLISIANAVGLGNIWRFPYLCYENGGGAFLIPYLVMVAFIGLPILLLELAVGQFSALGPVKAFSNIAPAMKGLGYAMIVITILNNIYYNMINAWALFFFFDSFRSKPDWQSCAHEFNTDRCFNELDYVDCKESNGSIFTNRTCFNATYATKHNLSDIADDMRVAATEEYFNRYVLNKSNGFDEMGYVSWRLLLCLLLAWVVVVLSLIKGIKTTGKVVYFTAIFPYLVLLALLIRGVTLPGSKEGILFYVTPDFSKLNGIKAWEDAAIQVFYSFSVGAGSMMTYSSYNRFHNGLVLDTFIIGMGDLLTSLFGGFVIFSMLGFMADQMNTEVSTVVQEGPGLAFIVYPNGISHLPLPTLWALLFFFMLFLIGIDSEFAGVETVITCIYDAFPAARKKKPLVVSLVGLILFLCGLPLTMNGGIYLFQVMNTYAAGWPVLLTGFLECIVVAYIYGVDRFLSDISNMTGLKASSWKLHHLAVTFLTVSPMFIAVILILAWTEYQPLKMGDYVYPTWGNAIGWVMTIVPIACVPLGILHEFFFKNYGVKIKHRIRLMFTPTDNWMANAERQKENDTESEKHRLETSTYDNLCIIAESNGNI